MWRKIDQQVYFLALYDAVDMTFQLDIERMSNVKYSYHVRRSPELGSRKSWRNTGTKAKGYYRQKFFDTSHGGMDYDVNTDSNIPFITDSTCTIPHSLAKKCLDESAEFDKWIRTKAIEKGIQLNSTSQVPGPNKPKSFRDRNQLSPGTPRSRF